MTDLDLKAIITSELEPHDWAASFQPIRGVSWSDEVLVIHNTTEGMDATVIDRSNRRRILEDHPYLVSTATRYNTSLAWDYQEDWDLLTGKEWVERMFEVCALIRGLADYPVYDESDWSELELEDTYEQWGQFYGDCEVCHETMPFPEDHFSMGTGDIEHDGESLRVSDDAMAEARAKHAPDCKGE